MTYFSVTVIEHISPVLAHHINVSIKEADLRTELNRRNVTIPQPPSVRHSLYNHLNPIMQILYECIGCVLMIDDVYF